MPKNNNIEIVYLAVRFGTTPSFEIKADEDPTVISTACKYTGSGTSSPADKAFLQQILNKLQTAFQKNSSTISLCIAANKWQIVEDSNCP